MESTPIRSLFGYLLPDFCCCDSHDLCNYRQVREEEVSSWLPIETAPKDGTVILVYCGDYQVPFMENMTHVARWKDEKWRLYWIFSHVSLEPTHWMPLPDPPKLGESVYDLVHD